MGDIMTERLKYDPSSGRIIALLSGPLDNDASGELLGGPFGSVDGLYVVDGKLVQRPSLGLPEHVSTLSDLSLGELPSGSIVYIDGRKVGVSDGSDVTVSFPLPRVYEVTVSPPFPYLELKMEVSVHEAEA